MWMARISRYVRKILALMVIAIGATASTASAYEFRVNSLWDDSDETPGDSYCATAEGECTLRAAVMEAAASPGDHVIRIGPGVYRLTGNSGEDAGRYGDLDLSVTDGTVKRLLIRGNGPSWSYCPGGCEPVDERYATTIVGPSSGDRVFDIAWSGDVVIENLAITGGYLRPAVNVSSCTVRPEAGAILATWDCESGGAIRSRSPLTLNNVAVYGNAAIIGGGIHSTQTLQLTSVAIVGNTTGDAVWRFDSGSLAPWFCGGGILHGAGPLVVSNSLIERNTSYMGGGGICTLATAVIRDSTIAGNISLKRGDGAGIRAVLDTVYGVLGVFDSTVRDNVAAAGNGGGISLRGVGLLHNVRVEHNRAANVYSEHGNGHGGGIAVRDEYQSIFAGMLALSASQLTVAGNRSDASGGGVYLGSSTRIARTEIFGATIANNRARDPGVAVYAEAHDLALTNVTISGNATSHATPLRAALEVPGLFAVESQVRLFHTTIAFNGADRDGYALSARDSEVAMKGNLLHRNDRGCYFTGGSPASFGGNLADSDSCPSDLPPDDVRRLALLDPVLQDNSPVGPALWDDFGPDTHALSAHSVAVDLITPGDCTAASGALLLADERGVERPVGAGCDAGAFEYKSFEWLLPPFPPRWPTEIMLLEDGARRLLAEMIRDNNPNMHLADDLVRELQLASQKLASVTEPQSAGQLIGLVETLAAHLSRAEQIRRSFGATSLGVHAARWQSLGLLSARAHEQLPR